MHCKPVPTTESSESRWKPTTAAADVAMPAVVKKDGARAEFDPSKLRGSMSLALRKRPVSTEQVDAAIERIEEKLSMLGADIRRCSDQW